MKNNFKRFIIGIFVVVLSILFTVNLHHAYAWNTAHSAQTICESGYVQIAVSFTNAESTKDMKVTAKDEQTGKETILGIVPAKQTKTGTINTGLTHINAGTVDFLLTWVQGSGHDVVKANYNAISCGRIVPTPSCRPTPKLTLTPTDTPITPTDVPVVPTDVPVTPTDAPVTPTPSLEITPTATPSSDVVNNTSVTDTSVSSPSVSAPVCPSGNTIQLPANPFVVRNGSHATVNFFITEGDSANIFWKLSSSADWQHSSAGTNPDGVKPNSDRFVTYTINDLVSNADYDFGIEQKTNCGGGAIIMGVIIDSPKAEVFRISYWIF